MLSDKATTDRDNIEDLITYRVIRDKEAKGNRCCVCDIRFQHEHSWNGSETGFGEYMKQNY